MSINVLVTGVGGGGHGEQIVKALQLADTDYRVLGADMNPSSKGLYDLDESTLLPPASDPGYLDAVLDYCRRKDVSVAFHGSEPELRAMSLGRERFAEAGIFLPINPRPVIDLCMDKLATMNWLAARGIGHPRYCRVSALVDLDAIDWLPAVLKPSVGSGGSANLFLAQTREDLIAFGRYLLQGFREFIAQEYVGAPDSEYTVGVLHDMQGGFINSIAVKRMILSGLSNRVRERNRTDRSDLGPLLAISSGVSQGEIGSFPEVTGPCEGLARELGVTGAINIQCRYWKGEVHVFEINPRFSGTTSLRAMVGYNEPDVLIRKHVLGETIEPRFSYRSGFILRGLAETYVEHLRESQS